MRRLSLLLAALLLASVAGAQDVNLQGATLLRLDAVDTAKAPDGEFTFYASLLDKYLKPIVVEDAAAWKVEIDGQEKTGKLTVKRLSNSDRGVSVAIVAAADTVFADGWFEHTRKGAADLINGLRTRDHSALVTFTDVVEATGGLSPQHEAAVGFLRERTVAGTTPPLFEAIEKALDFFPADYTSIGPNRVLVVVSDGGDKNAADAAKTKALLLKLQQLARSRNVRVNVIAAKIITPDSLQSLQALAHATGGTYRLAETGPDVETFFDHTKAELLGQHVVTFLPDDFDDEKESSFKVEVKHDNLPYASKPLIAPVPQKKSNLLKWLLIGGGALVGVVLLYFLVRLTVHLVRRRDDEQEEEEGPELAPCPQCNNMIPPEWKVCQYCEALPHKGRLTVVSVGDLNGRTFFLKESLSNIGSATGNTIILFDKSVSKRHAGIKIQDNRFELADFGSTNGVLVNGQRVTKQFLKNKDVITVGAVELEFTLK